MIPPFLVACLMVGVSSGPCHVASPTKPATPTWATPAVQEHLAGIVAGETVLGCPKCDLWIACTIRRDIERGWNPWLLHPGRWHGWKAPSDSHRASIAVALSLGGCANVPRCKYLGNIRDYRLNWTSHPAIVIGTPRGLIACVEEVCK